MAAGPTPECLELRAHQLAHQVPAAHFVVDREELAHRITEVLCSLSSREREVIEGRFGLREPVDELS